MGPQAVTPRQINRMAAALIVVAGLLAYAGSFSGPFVLDDPSSITANPTIRRLWPPWEVLATPRANVTVQGRPLLNLSFAINYALSGHAVWSYHAFNLAIHLLAGLTLFGIVRRTLAPGVLTRGVGGRHWPATDPLVAPERIATLLGLAVALLWTVHPLQTESVTYVVQRAESLMGLFYLLTLYCFIRYAEGGPPARLVGWGGRAVLAGLAGMATKEVMVTAPVMVLLYDRTFVARSFQEAWRKRRTFHAGLAATWLLLAVCVLSGGGNRGGAVGFGTGVAWWSYGLTQFEALGRYLLLSFWPHPLVFEYGAFTVQQVGQVLPWAVIVVPLVAGTFWALWRQPALGFLGAWFFGILAPTSLVPGTSQMIVEHRMYLSLAAVLALAVCSIHALTCGWAAGLPPSAIPRGRPTEGAPPGPGTTVGRGAGVAFLALVLLAATGLGWLTAERNALYRTALGLWSETAARRPANPLAHHLLAEELARGGRTSEALAHYRQAVRLDPGFSLAHERLGELLVRLGQPEEAVACFRESLRLTPDFADAHNNLGVLLGSRGQVEQGVAHIERALALAPDYAEAHFNLANFRALLGRVNEAVAHYEQALRLKPDFPAAHYNLANTLAGQERPGEAIAHYEQALRLQPDYPAAEFNLANVLAATARRKEAVGHYRRALQLKPDFAAAEMNLGSVLFELGRFDEAEAHYLAALRLDPSLAGARENLARVRAAQGR